MIFILITVGLIVNIFLSGIFLEKLVNEQKKLSILGYFCIPLLAPGIIMCYTVGYYLIILKFCIDFFVKHVKLFK